MPNDVRHMQQV